MRTNIEACLSEVADWYIKNRMIFDSTELHNIIKKYCNTVFEQQYVMEYLGTEKGKSHFKRVLTERVTKSTEPIKYVQTPTRVISVESWEKERDEMIRRGEKPPEVKYINKPSELREKQFVKVGDRIRFIGAKGRVVSWPEGVWLEKGIEGTVTDYTDYRSDMPELGEVAVVKFDNGATSSIAPEDEGKRWVRVKPSELREKQTWHPDYIAFLKTLKGKTVADVEIRKESHPAGFKGDYYRAYLSGTLLAGNESIYSLRETVEELFKRAATLEKPSELRQPSFDYIDDACQQVPAKYRDLLPFLDTYPVGSFLLEQSTSPGTAKIDAILQKLKDGVAAIQDSTLFREYLLTMSKFWSYSVGNLILIMLQKRDATRVAGFTTWKELGRFVKAGEKGIMILAPCLPPKGGYEYWVRGNDKYSVRFLEGQWYTYDINNKRGVGGPFKSKVEAESDLSRQGFSKVKEAPEESYETPRYFKVVYVFDISQTQGKELPEIEVKSLTGAANPELWDKMIALLKRKGVNLSFESKPDQDPEIKGQFMMPNNIWVRPEESPAQQLKTIIHECGHYYTEGVFGTPRADAETIAESVAFVVGAHFGFDSGTRSFSYVAVWSKDVKVLNRNLASIKNISGSILNDMEVKA